MAKKSKKKATKKVVKKLTPTNKPIKTEPKKERLDLSNDMVLNAECRKYIKEGLRQEVEKFLYSKQQVSAENVSKLAVMLAALK